MTWKLRKMANAADRILVNFVKDGKVPVKAKFTESILDTLGLVTGNDLPIYADLKNDRLLLGNKPNSYQQKPVKIRRPSFCPIHNMSKAQLSDLPEETVIRGIDVGCAVILEAADGKVLITRRAPNLRTFPNVWVPPGGHVESNETLSEAGLRELREETGLSISKAQCVEKQIPILALWESAFPPMLSSGLPKRHHAVVYLYAKLTSEHTSEMLQDQLQLDNTEVGASAWVDRDLAKAIVMASEETTNPQKLHAFKDLPETVSVTIVQEDGSTAEEDLQTSILLQVATGGTTDVERVSTGTKFALEEWLKHKPNKRH